MKNVNLKVVFSDLIKRWYLVLLTCIICSGLFAYNGYNKAQQTLSEEKMAELEEYEKALTDYDEAIANVVELRAQGEAQVKDQQEYNDHSIYMKLNPNDYVNMTLQYTVDVAEGTDLGRVLTGYVQYINSGSFYSGVASMTQVEGLTEAYLKELGSVGTNGNILTLTISMPDEDSANKVMKSAKMAMDSRRDAIALSFGEFEINLLEESVFHSASMDVLNRQMGAVNNLKSYLNAAADYETKEINTRASKDSYIEKNEPEETEVKDKNKELIKGGILGVVVGLVICFALALLIYIMGNKLKSYEDMLFAKVAVLGRCKKGKFNKETSAMSQELELMAAMRDTDLSGVTLYPLSDSAEVKDAVEKLKAECGLESTGSLKDIVDKGNAILLVQCGNTTYAQIEEARRVLEQLKTDVWGCMVVE